VALAAAWVEPRDDPAHLLAALLDDPVGAAALDDPLQRPRRVARVPFAAMAWPEPVERVARALREAAAESRIEEFPQGTPSVAAAAKAIGCDPGQVVKSIVFDCDGRFVVALVPGDRRADASRIAELARSPDARIATAEQVVEATGFAPGAVAPFPLPRVAEVLADRALLAHELVWVGAGSETHMAALSPADLLRLSRARTVDLVGRR
jgi:prolyl-tRNA editing enzyme YbaK/EbsC (Cys-tRNA(Pro) deacylase)